MYQGNGVFITAVANGFKVLLPQAPQRWNARQFKKAKLDAEIKRQAVLVKEVWEKDELLSDLQNEVPEELQPTDDTVTLVKSDCEYYFSTFPEVLDFLKYKINPEAMAGDEDAHGIIETPVMM